LPRTPPLRHGFVVAGRQTPYKRIDLAVEACSRLNVPLIVIGRGPEHHRLEKLAGRSVTFLQNVTDEEMPKHFQSANAFIFPTNIEDFGVTGVEAMAAGTPVIAYFKGGPADYIIPGRTGQFFDKLSADSLVSVLENFKPSSYNNAIIAEHAQLFSAAAFQRKLKDFIKTARAKQ
jgi:glycosyltransferase involved in cell wall biosynthesis